MRPTSGSSGHVLLDTSAAIALILPEHEQHGTAMSAALGRRLGLSGHAAFETFSVLTRLPAPLRRTPQAAKRLIASDFPETRFLSIERAAALLESLPAYGIAGGAVYDALVGAAALEHELTLVTLDRRALGSYHRLGVAVEFLS